MHAIHKVQHRDYEVMVGATQCADGVIRVSATCEGGDKGLRSYFRFSSHESSVDEACARAIRDLCLLVDKWRRTPAGWGMMPERGLRKRPLRNTCSSVPKRVQKVAQTPRMDYMRLGARNGSFGRSDFAPGSEFDDAVRRDVEEVAYAARILLRELQRSENHLRCESGSRASSGVST